MPQPPLPDYLAEELRTQIRRVEIDRNDSYPLSVLTSNLYDAGWGYPAMSEATGWLRGRLHHYAQKVPAGQSYSTMPEIVPPPETNERRPAKAHLDDATKVELRSLQRDAVRLRGGHPPGHKFRIASELLTRRLKEEHQRGVTYRELGTAIGVKAHAVRTRFKRHSVIPPNPSLRPYRHAHEEN